MRRIVIVGLCLVAGFAMSAVAAANANIFTKFDPCQVSNPSVKLCFLTTDHSRFIAGPVNPLTELIGHVKVQGGLDATGMFVYPVPAAVALLNPWMTVNGTLALLPPPPPSPLLTKYNAALPPPLSHKLQAKLELVGTPEVSTSNLLTGEGSALTLPIRIHLRNTGPIFLGSQCFIGSALEPIVLQLTTGVTSPPPPGIPLAGSVGTASLSHGGTLLKIYPDTMVENAFAVPGAQGCGPAPVYEPEVDSLVDAAFGLPSPAGENTMELSAGTWWLAEAAKVKAEGFGH